MLENYPDIDCWVSLVGLPRNMSTGAWELEKVTTYQRPTPPVVAVDVGLGYDPAVIRQYIEGGQLTAAVIVPSMEKPVQKVITREKLADLPAQSPAPPEMMAPPGGMMPPTP